MGKLRIPCAIAFTVVATTVAVGAAISACGHGQPPPTDGMVITDGSGCQLFCIPDGTDAGVCPNPAPCADPMGNCPAGCRPVG